MGKLGSPSASLASSLMWMHSAKGKLEAALRGELWEGWAPLSMWFLKEVEFLPMQPQSSTPRRQKQKPQAS